MTSRATWLCRSVTLVDLISRLRQYGAAPKAGKALTASLAGGLAIATGLAVSDGTNVEDVDSTGLGTSTTPTPTAGSIVTGPDDGNVDSLGAGRAGQAFYGWIDPAEIICVSSTSPTPDMIVVNPCQVTDGNGLSKKFKLFLKALDRVGALY